MNKIEKKTIVTIFFLAFLVTIIISQITQGSSLQITIATDKESYNLGENVLLTGNLTLDGSPVSDGLVSIQVDDPKNDHFLIRTLPTGPNLTGPWAMEILEVIPVGLDCKPRYSFQQGDLIGFNITVKNGIGERNVTITITTCYSDGVPFTAMEFTRFTPLHSNDIVWKCFPGLIEIAEDAPLGMAVVYVDAFTGWPSNGGFAYCPEKSANFEIVESGLASTGFSTSLTANPTSTTGNFNTTFRIPPRYGKLGDYDIYTISFYSPWLTTSHLTFEVVLTTDITGPGGVPDGKVDMRDVATAARAFGAHHVTDPASPKYCEYWHDPPCLVCPHNPKCDIYYDGKVDMKDIATIARDFGKIGIPDC